VTSAYDRIIPRKVSQPKKTKNKEPGEYQDPVDQAFLR